MGAKELSKEEVAKLPTLLDIVNHLTDNYYDTKEPFIIF